MNRNSLRNRPTPTAPARTAASASPGCSILASSSTLWPSLVIAQAGQALAFQFGLALAKAVCGQDDGRGIDDHHAGIAVDDDPVVLARQLAGSARSDHGRDAHAARHDGGVRGLAADIGDEAGKHALL